MISRLGDRGSATAEFAIAVPAILLVLAMGIGALSTASRQVRLQDAVADAARLIARDEDQGRALGIVSAAADGAVGSVQHEADLVCVSAAAPGVLPGLRVTARSCALGGGL
ncbi:TadE family type IV pilus minor pilin [Microbacterium sp. NPDC089189]|uniref:TadE family type IV pilus minor pilin n=1 Tax=Microbacterium sp. NPDC089189 TaxID=3154972 RepID=UPI003431E53C